MTERRDAMAISALLSSPPDRPQSTSSDDTLSEPRDLIESTPNGHLATVYDYDDEMDAEEIALLRIDPNAPLSKQAIQELAPIAGAPVGAGPGAGWDKDQYLASLQNRINSIVSNESDGFYAYQQSGQDRLVDLANSKSQIARVDASKRLHEEALAVVLKREESELKEKRRILKRLERQRKREEQAPARAAAAAAAAAARAEKRKARELERQQKESERAAAKAAAQTLKEEAKAKRAAAKQRKDKEKKEEKETKAQKTNKRKRDSTASGDHNDSVDGADGADGAGVDGDAGEDDRATTVKKVKLRLGRKGDKEKGEKGDKAKGDKGDKGDSEATPSTKKSRSRAKADADGAPKPPSQKEIKAIARLYNNTYESVWKEMSRRDASRVFKLYQSTVNIHQSNARKTASLASKEARKWQYRTNKNFKDMQAKARRSMKEMLAFWRRNEREERELQRKAEKEAIELAKKEEEERESRRQARKLNFLITQTELYTHFIGRKIDGDQQDTPGESGAESRVEDVDFDTIEDDELRKLAMANAQSAVQQTKEKARTFTHGQDLSTANSGELKKINIDDDEMNFQNPTSLGELTIPQPKMLTCQLKEYQVKGLNWLANLYEQGINGILADEMGLGKTVQSISVMAYLAETHNIWGPFLVIAPASTLHNWQQEIAKFIPQFKVLPYWGSGKDRKVLRKFWDRKQLTYTRDSPFHVLVTSYQLVVADAAYFQRVKWQYMILDEAQAIKSSSSARWKSLLDFQCRNRLLLTGTPVQNSMQELWALLHFIMPSLFDSHEEFSEWFSKDIESHAQTNSSLNEQQLKRLHMILKPFMLRRVKKNVQSELGDKIEIDLYCDLTNRQRVLYRMLKSQISVMDLIERATSGNDESNQSLMNLVMQFRKVCNHPDLFEREDVKSALNFATFGDTASLAREGGMLEVNYSARNLVQYQLPKLVFRQGGLLNVPTESSAFGNRRRLLNQDLSIWQPINVQKRTAGSNGFSWLRFSGYSAGDAHRVATWGPLERVLRGEHGQVEELRALQAYHAWLANDDTALAPPVFDPVEKLFLIDAQRPAANRFLNASSHAPDSVMAHLLNIPSTSAVDEYYHVLEPAFDERVLCPPIELTCSDRTLTLNQEDLLMDREVLSALAPMSLDREWRLMQSGLQSWEFPRADLFPDADNPKAGTTTIQMPSMARFVSQSGKLKKLDSLLTDLKANDHRVLIYFQMTKMMDMMEEYLTFRQHKYVRLDGSSKLSERRDLVNDWQTKPELFIFLLSTRAGGLGINLTAADTVIFYDSDWNPTIDSQAMDRAHRLGQTRQVTVYRLLVKGTIEERMRDRAKQKMHVQNVVMEGGDAKTGVDFKDKPGREVAFWLLDDDAAVDEALRHKEEKSKTTTKKGKNGKRAGSEPKGSKKAVSLEDMYHENEGNFDESSRPSDTSTVASAATSGTSTPIYRKPGRKLTTEQKLRVAGDIV